MCESKASIWWKTVHWCQCNSYEGMHKLIEMPSRYLTNCKEEFCLLSFLLRAFSWTVPLIAYLHGLKLLAALLFIGLHKKRYCTAITKGKTTGSCLFTEAKPCCTRLISRWVTIWTNYPVLYNFLGSHAGVVNTNHAFHLYVKYCMWIEFQSISTWLRGFSPGTPVSSFRLPF